jgi:prophage tail gpP-like protein
VNHVVELKRFGVRHRGLIRGSITLSIEQIAPPFQCTYAEALGSEKPRYFGSGDFISLLIDDEVVTDGYVDVSRRKQTVGDISYDFNGRGSPLDLVDCTALVRPRQFKNAKVDQIATKILAPFGFTVRALDDVGDPIRRFTLDKNDTAFGATLRAAKLRGLWPRYMGGEKVIELVKLDATVESVPIIVGVNAFELEHISDWTQRFGSYHMVGTTHATDDVTGIATRIRDKVVDPAIGRYRPLRIEVRGGDGSKDAGIRAKQERNMRAGNSDRFVAKISGWRDRDGTLWRPNQLRRCRADRLGIDENLVITTAKYAWDQHMKDGFVTELELKRPEALDLDASYPEG